MNNDKRMSRRGFLGFTTAGAAGAVVGTSGCVDETVDREDPKFSASMYQSDKGIKLAILNHGEEHRYYVLKGDDDVQSGQGEMDGIDAKILNLYGTVMPVKVAATFHRNFVIGENEYINEPRLRETQYGRDGKVRRKADTLLKFRELKSYKDILSELGDVPFTRLRAIGQDPKVVGFVEQEVSEVGKKATTKELLITYFPCEN